MPSWSAASQILKKLALHPPPRPLCRHCAMRFNVLSSAFDLTSSLGVSMLSKAWQETERDREISVSGVAFGFCAVYCLV